MHKVKRDRQMEEKYMTLEELLKDRYKEGHAEGLAEGRTQGLAEGTSAGRKDSVLILLQSKGEVSAALESSIRDIADEERINALLKLAASAQSVEEFEEKANL